MLIAPAGIITNVALMSLLDSKAQQFALIWMLIGLVVYFIYSRNKSNLNEM
jgi:basic amino acid/polyamine antiporter, APA family